MEKHAGEFSWRKRFIENLSKEGVGRFRRLKVRTTYVQPWVNEAKMEKLVLVHMGSIAFSSFFLSQGKHSFQTIDSKKIL